MVSSGLEIVKRDEFQQLKGKKVGLLAHPSSITSCFEHAADIFSGNSFLNLVALFGPEHGLQGVAQDMQEVDHSRDKRTGLPVYSLYGAGEESLSPDDGMLDEIDVIVIDLQDIGSRYYTYIWTMADVLRVCGRLGRKVVVLDRPNPINGVHVEGPILQEEFSSFVGRYPIAIRHGMTVGELAVMLTSRFGIQADVEVVKMEGWQRELWFDETGLPWVMPSPNMPTLDTASVYPGMCLLEGTNLSEGRGTTRPFEMAGAPWLDPDQFADLLMKEGLPGIIFRPIYFRPIFHKWKGEVCGGVQLHVIDRQSFRPFITGVSVIKAALRMDQKQFAWREEPYEFVSDRLAFDLLAGGEELRSQIEEDLPLNEIEESWQGDLEAFLSLRKEFLLY